MIDRPARQGLILALDQIVDGDADYSALDDHHLKTSDRTVIEFVDHFNESEFRLPLSRHDDLSHPDPGTIAEMKRAILFLRTDMTYVPPRASLFDRAIFICMIVFLLSVVAELFIVERLVAPAARVVHITMFITGGIFMGSLFVGHLIFLGFAAVHIFRVRILGREVSSHDPDDLWPFETAEQMRQAETLTLTSAAPS